MKKTLFVLGFLVLVSVAPVLAQDPVYYGSTPNLDNSWQGLPVCGEAAPKAPILYEPNNPTIQKAKNPGEVRLQWAKVPQAVGYNVYFGLSPRNYIYSAVNLGDVDNYTVRLLGNRAYYFAVQSKGNCAISPLSNEWAARPVGSGRVFTSFVPAQRETNVNNNVNVEKNVQVQPPAPKLSPLAPVAPKPKKVVAPVSQNFFQSIFSFFSRLFFGGK